MKYSIKSIWTGTIFEDEATSFSALVEAAVKAKISLFGANLRYANLIGANLIGADLIDANLSNANLSNADLIDANLSNADLSNADLSNADLSNADLSNADLSNADLRYADLIDANLRYADLIDANLRYADLSNADLSNADLIDANLRYADLSNADLRDADLRDANLPSPTTVLQAWWSGDLSDSLVADLMEFDASAHPDRTLFDKWAAGGACPYADVKIQRAANFSEKKELWGKGKLQGSYELMIRLFAERNIKR